MNNARHFCGVRETSTANNNVCLLQLPTTGTSKTLFSIFGWMYEPRLSRERKREREQRILSCVLFNLIKCKTKLYWTWWAYLSTYNKGLYLKSAWFMSSQLASSLWSIKDFNWPSSQSAQLQFTDPFFRNGSSTNFTENLFTNDHFKSLTSTTTESFMWPAFNSKLWHFSLSC